MHEFMLNIDNKEILNEILHHSVDYMIGSYTESNSIKSSLKYGFSDPNEFESAIKTIANAYKLYCLNTINEIELLSNFSHMNHDLQQSVIDVFKARRNEIIIFLLREHNSKDNKLLESFDWDVRFIMGDSNLISHRAQIANIIFNCLEPNGKKSSVHIEIDKKNVDKLIKILEECDKILQTNQSSSNNKKPKDEGEASGSGSSNVVADNI